MPNETEVLKNEFDNVEFVSVENIADTGFEYFQRPLIKISAMMKWFLAQKQETCMIINSDIELLPDTPMMKAISLAAKHAFVLGKRWNYQSDKKSAKIEPWGIDFFTLNKSIARLYPEDTIYCMGECFWDYWICCYPMLAKQKMYCINQKFALHKAHPLQWKQETWQKIYHVFANEMSSKMAGLHQGDMYSNMTIVYKTIIDRSTPLAALQPCNVFDSTAYLSALIEKFRTEINGIIHVGAHHGSEIEEYRRLGCGPVVFFEPLEANFKKLLSNMAKKGMDNVESHQVALGASEFKSYMFVETSNRGQSSSLLAPKEHLKLYPKIEFNQKEIVQVRTLDSYGFEGYNTLIMDVQGYEGEVIKGGVLTITEHIDYIISEVNLSELYQGCILFPKLITLLDALGFVLKDFEYAENNWGNAFFERKTITR